MSFLDAVISSIGTGGGSSYVPPPKRVPGEPLGTYSIIGQPKGENESSTGVNKPSSLAGTKRKAEDGSRNSTGSSSLPSAALAAKKKNSFAAIMARGKEASAKNDPTSIGSIKHKPKEKSKAFKEIAAERKAAKEAIRKGIPIRNVLESRNSANKIHPESKKPVPEERPQTATSGYKGTIKSPEQPKYTGTMKPATTTPKYSGTAKPGRSSKMQSGRRQAAAKRPGQGYEDDEDDDSDNSYGRDDDGYYDDSDDDMDAGFDAVEDEEEQASRAARKEDALAQAELDRLASEKARKKAFLGKGKH